MRQAAGAGHFACVALLLPALHAALPTPAGKACPELVEENARATQAKHEESTGQTKT